MKTIFYVNKNSSSANFICYARCKKIPKGKSVSLDEIFEDIKNLPLNRNQRRKMPNKIDNPDIIKDVVKGPALQVIPIAIYQ